MTERTISAAMPYESRSGDPTLFDAPARLALAERDPGRRQAG